MICRVLFQIKELSNDYRTWNLLNESRWKGCSHRIFKWIWTYLYRQYRLYDGTFWGRKADRDRLTRRQSHAWYCHQQRLPEEGADKKNHPQPSGRIIPPRNYGKSDFHKTGQCTGLWAYGIQMRRCRWTICSASWTWHGYTGGLPGEGTRHPWLRRRQEPRRYCHELQSFHIRPQEPCRICS